MPAIEASVAFSGVLGRDLSLVEAGVLRVLQFRFSETLIVVHGTVSNQLDLRNSGNGLEVRVEYRLAILLSFVVAMTVGIACGIEGLGGGLVMKTLSLPLLYLHAAGLDELVLLLRREICVSEEQYIMLTDT